ncbi:MAG: hypothetical protein HY904_11565 [Deltaproteobacteria bacterium]|nr:hypothetical protein [Deltaproteobacteria bacterium]
MALGALGAWDGVGATTVLAAPFPAKMLQAIQPAALSEVVALIESYPDSQLEEVVERIPDPYMHPRLRREVRTALSRRKALVRSALKEYL